MANRLYKYPRTQHIEGSRPQQGDEDLQSVPFAKIAGRWLVVEEKMDGANSAVSFDSSGNLQLQSRGHYLTGGAREKHFNLFKQWASVHAGTLWDRLGDRYVMYGEWLYAKHTIFYDTLPHYFLEFDVLDAQTEEFLDTPRRQELLAGGPVVSVKVLQAGTMQKQRQLTDLIGDSYFIRPGHLQRLREACEQRNLDADQAIRETARDTLMEGLYIKVEEQGQVVERYKFVRADFLSAVCESESHWLNRPIIPNLLADGVDLFGESA